MKKRILPFLALMLMTTMSFAQARQILVTLEDSIVDKVNVMYIAGSFNDWDPAVDMMTKVTDSTYTFDFESADTADITFKFLTGPDWAYEQTRTADFRYSTDSITRVGEFNAYFDPTAEPQEVTIEVLVPAEVYVLYLTGNFVDWDPDSVQMEQIDSTQDGKVFSVTIEVMDSTVLEYKFIAGPGWAYEQTETANYKYSEVGGTVVCDEFKNIFNPNNVGNITLNITVPEGTPDVWIIGSFTDNWNPEAAVQATQVDDTTWTILIEDVADIEYKVYNYPDWDYEEASDDQGNNIDNRQASFLDGPTFDIVVAFWKDVFEQPTSVKDPVDSKIRVYTTRYQTIVAEGVVDKVTIFDIQGRIVQDVRTKGTFTSKALRSGVYIIRVDDKVKKVSVQ